MSKNIRKNQPTNIANAYAAAKATKATDKTTKPAPRPFLTNTALKYLGAAFEKARAPLHPNFVAKITPTTLGMYKAIQATANETFKANRDASPKRLIVVTSKALANDTRSYIQFWKDIASNSAFAARMDLLALKQAIDIDAVEAKLNSMLDDYEEDGLDAIDLPVYDATDAQRASPREAYAGETVEPLATSENDVYEAINVIQAWCGVAVSSFNDDQQQYWGVDGLFPFAQERIADNVFGSKYIPIRDFDDYVAWSDKQYRLKRNTVKDADNIADQLEAA